MKKRKVMLIDDEEDFINMLKKNLEQTKRYEVLALSSAKNIVSKVKDFNPDIILLDLLMPEVGGIEACQMLNEDPIGKRIPIIALSALDKDTDKLKAYKVGVVDYLTKPAQTETIIKAIEKALEFK
ncbi:MAG: response regulator [Candidatus Ratteibacteria bacterium]|nr:response regulator [Candidatus Ratteibacteria bacterium]